MEKEKNENESETKVVEKHIYHKGDSALTTILKGDHGRNRKSGELRNPNHAFSSRSQTARQS